MLVDLGREAAKYADFRTEHVSGTDAFLVGARLVIAPEAALLERWGTELVNQAQDQARSIVAAARSQAEAEVKQIKEKARDDLRQLWESFNGYDECAGRR